MILSNNMSIKIRTDFIDVSYNHDTLICYNTGDIMIGNRDDVVWLIMGSIKKILDL